MIIRLFLDIYKDKLVYTTSEKYAEKLKDLGLKSLGIVHGFNITIEHPTAITAEKFLKEEGEDA